MQLSPFRADANVECARHNLITLISVRMNVQRRSCKARGKHVDGLKQIASRIGSGLGNLPPHADGGEVKDAALFFGCHIAGLTRKSSATAGGDERGLKWTCFHKSVRGIRVA